MQEETEYGLLEDLPLSSSQSHAVSNNKKKSSLLASLTGDDFLSGDDHPVMGSSANELFSAKDSDDEDNDDEYEEDEEEEEEEEEEDLFGKLPSAQPMEREGGRMDGNGLLGSGLLESGGGGGLFDEVDAAAEQQKLYQERIELERLEKERLEQERLELERRAAEEMEQERRAKREREMLEKEQAEAVALAASETERKMQELDLNSATAASSLPPSSFYRDHPIVEDVDRIIEDPLSSNHESESEPIWHSAYTSPPPPTPPVQSFSAPPPRPPPQIRPTTLPPTQPMPQPPSLLAGLHNKPSHASAVPVPLPPPPDFTPIYQSVTVDSPKLHQAQGFFTKPPHWTYQVTTKNNDQFISVRRRFRHFVALEERLREACPGSILPPRPDKHPTRALEEGLQQQSPAFAQHRAIELQLYLRNLIHHPQAGISAPLRLFLTLPDHIGTAWPEVSHSPLTRISTISTTAAVKLSENTTSALHPGAGEDSAEILALATSEGLRLGAITQSVPKMEGSIALMKDLGEKTGHVGMELAKLSKNVQITDKELSSSLDILSNCMLRSGRRTKRLAAESGAAFEPLVYEYKMVKNERGAFQDRRQALMKRLMARQNADLKARRLVEMQAIMEREGRIGILERMEMEAAMSDENAMEAEKECEGIGRVLMSEVSRLRIVRRREWMESVKVMASAWKECCAERGSIWEGARVQFEEAFGREYGTESAPQPVGRKGPHGPAPAVDVHPTMVAGLGPTPTVVSNITEPSMVGNLPENGNYTMQPNRPVDLLGGNDFLDSASIAS